MDGEGLIQLVILVGAGLSFLWGKRQEEARKSRPRVKPGVQPQANETPARRGEKEAPARRGGIEALFETLQAELERASGAEEGTQRRGPMGRVATRRIEEAEDVEERESLEEQPRVISLEESPTRTPRVQVDYDDEAAAVSQRRILAAQSRNRALTRKDHAAFDQRIRKGEGAPPAAAPAARPRLPSMGLRQAIIWQEILSPPVSERPSGMSER